MTNDMSVEQWLAVRKEAALKIDPTTAQIFWTYAQTLDPYGVEPNLPPECNQVGRVWFARAPESDVWVAFDDLPSATCDALSERNERMKKAGAFSDVYDKLLQLLLENRLLRDENEFPRGVKSR